MAAVSVILPAYNEADSIRGVVERVRRVLREADWPGEILVVVDGATDGTAEEARAVADRVIEHPQNLGYGRSLKTGILHAEHDLIAISDADGTYPVERLPELLALAEQFHMVVGARTGTFYQGGLIKRIGRFVFRQLSQFAAGQRIPDINSGLRVFRRSQIIAFFPFISAGFSFTTTATLAYLLNDLFVHYVPIDYHRRAGTSKVRHVRDSLRALQVIVEAILRFNPIKIYLLLAVPFLLIGLGLAAGALARHSGIYGICSIATLCTSGLLLGMGFLAVAVMPQRRVMGLADRIVPTGQVEAGCDDKL